MKTGNHLNPDGTLRIVQWAGVNAISKFLTIDRGPRSFQMANSDATGDPILSNGNFGCDIIRFDAGKGVPAHTHEGNHILLVLLGTGFVFYDQRPYALKAGYAYLIEGSVVHAIKATTELILMAIGDNHFPVDSQERMTPVCQK